MSDYRGQVIFIRKRGYSDSMIAKEIGWCERRVGDIKSGIKYHDGTIKVPPPDIATKLHELFKKCQDMPEKPIKRGHKRKGSAQRSRSTDQSFFHVVGGWQCD